MTQELSSYIDSVYREPYSLMRNNCIHKTLKIRAKARELGKQADLIFSLLFFSVRKLRDLPLLTPHLYLIINGRKIDVPLSPAQERKICKNIDVLPLISLNVSELARKLRFLIGLKAVCRSEGYLPDSG